MIYSTDRMNQFTELLDRHAVWWTESLPSPAINGVYLIRKTEMKNYKVPRIYDPGIAMLAQGRKVARVGDQVFDYGAGRYLAVFLPMAVEVEVVEASEDEPILMFGIKMDLNRIANILMKIDRFVPPTPVPDYVASGIYAESVTDELLDPMIRLLQLLDNPLDREILGESILDEIYYRLILNDKSGALRHLLHHRGQIPQISRTVDHIHHNLEKVVSVNELAQMVNMSPSGYRKAFREVMHMPPLQYAKSIKLDRAQLLLRQGKNASEAGYLVGYNSPAQFSREYKRHFGYAPSETVI